MDIVQYIEHPSIEQIKWGGNDDPRELLEVGVFYEVILIEEHSMHTKITLKDFPCYKFNSVSFK